MIVDTNMTMAFFDGAGVYPSDVQLSIRTALVAGVFIWGVWVIIGTVQALPSPEMTAPIFVWRLIMVLIMITGSLLLVSL